MRADGLARKSPQNPHFLDSQKKAPDSSSGAVRSKSAADVYSRVRETVSLGAEFSSI
jgi:hypothetical protein